MTNQIQKPAAETGTALYAPYGVPPANLLKWALLYWDRVRWISLPRRSPDEGIPYNAELKESVDAGLLLETQSRDYYDVTTKRFKTQILPLFKSRKQITFADIADKHGSIRVQTAQASISVEHNGPFVGRVPVQLAKAPRSKAHSDAGEVF